MNEPTQDDIERLKAANPDRALKMVYLEEKDGENLCFVVSGPNRVEYDKLVEDAAKVEREKNDLDKTMGVRKIMENLCLQQIRWPERSEVLALFDRFPTIPVLLGSKIREATGDSFEVRVKKL